MSCVIPSPFACHSEAEPKNLKDCSGQALRQAQDRLRRRISERSKILHGACPETLRGVYPERDARSFAESTLSEANVLRMTQREGFRVTVGGCESRGGPWRHVRFMPQFVTRPRTPTTQADGGDTPAMRGWSRASSSGSSTSGQGSHFARTGNNPADDQRSELNCSVRGTEIAPLPIHPPGVLPNCGSGQTWGANSS